MIIYKDTEKELFLEDYKPLPLLRDVPVSDLYSLLNNLEQAYYNTYCFGSDFLGMAIYDDIITVKRRLLTMSVSSMSSGTVAGIIGSAKYIQIDRAINKTLLYLFHAEPEEIAETGTEPEQINELIIKCYHNKDL